MIGNHLTETASGDMLGQTAIWRQDSRWRVRSKRDAPMCTGDVGPTALPVGVVNVLWYPASVMSRAIAIIYKGDWSMERISVYVDGFNLYYGLKARRWRRYYWLDLRRMSENLLRPNQTLVSVRYFTAEISPEPDDLAKKIRQNIYLEALETLPNLSIHYGYFLPKVASCRNCGATWDTYEEKMTDVNIAVELLGDAQDNAFDAAIVVSGDSDLAGPISALRERYSNKRVLVAFPPNRASKKLREVASATFSIGRDVFRDSQLPERVVNLDGYELTRPGSWR